MSSKADKTTADTECKNLGGNIFTSKSEYSNFKLASYLDGQSSIENIYLGMKKSDDQWTWDDTKTTVFAERKYSQTEIQISKQKKINFIKVLYIS